MALIAPSCTGDSTKLQGRIEAAVGAGDKSISVPSADYCFGNRTFLIAGGNGIKIYSAGATLWFSDADGGVLLKNCIDVTFSGFVIDRYPPPFVQAIAINASGTDGSTLFDIPVGYPTQLAPWYSVGQAGDWQPLVYHYSSTLQPDGLPTLTGGCGAYIAGDGGNVHWLGPRRFVMRPGCPFAQNDSLVAIVWQGFSYTVANGSRVVTENISVHASGYMAVEEMDGAGGNVFRNVSVTPRNGRIISSTADGECLLVSVLVCLILRSDACLMLCSIPLIRCRSGTAY